MDQEFRWYSTFERLNQNFMKIRISLVRHRAAPVLNTGQLLKEASFRPSL